MRLLSEIHKYKVLVNFTGGLDSARQWSEYMQPYWIDQTAESLNEADLVMNIHLLPGWMNSCVVDDFEFAYDDNALQSVRIEKPAISGGLFREPSRYCGTFNVSGDYPDSIDVAIGTCLSFLCEERGDLLLHSSAVLREEKSWLFLGKGGAGKTTIAVELNGGSTPMSVDRTLVCLNDRGDFCAFSTPFGDRNFVVKEVRRAPIAGLVFVEQAPKHELIPVSPWEATRLILAQTIAPTRSRATVQKVMDAVGKLVDLGCCYKLRFKKDDGFWPLIDEALAMRK